MQQDLGTAQIKQSFWLNTSACPVPIVAEPEDSSVVLAQLLPQRCIRARKAIIRDGKVWLEVDREPSGSLVGWLLFPTSPAALTRVLGPGDPSLSSPAFTWLSSLLAPTRRTTTGGVITLALYCNAYDSELSVYAEPSKTSKTVGSVAAFATVAVDEHRLTEAGQMWARLCCSQQWFTGSTEGWVCTSGGERGQSNSGPLELETAGLPWRGHERASTMYVRNILVRGPRAFALPLRREPRLSAPVMEGGGMTPWTAKEVRAAVLNEEGQLWLRLGGLGDGAVWVIRRSAKGLQVVAEFCEGPWPASGVIAHTTTTAYYRNVYNKGALPLRTAPSLEAPAATRMPMGTCLKAMDRVLSEEGHCWIGVMVEGAAVWAIAWHARDGSTILKEILPPMGDSQNTRVYRVVQGGLRAVPAPGYTAGDRSEARELNAGECFRSSERRMNERHEMWVRVDGGLTTQGEDLWVPESSGGVADSVVALDVDVVVAMPTAGEAGRAPKVQARYEQPPLPRFAPAWPTKNDLVAVAGAKVSSMSHASSCTLAGHKMTEEEEAEEEKEQHKRSSRTETEEGEGHLLHEVFGYGDVRANARAQSTTRKGLLQDLDLFAEDEDMGSGAGARRHSSHHYPQGRTTPTQPSTDQEHKAYSEGDDEEEDEEEDPHGPPPGCCQRLRDLICPVAYKALGGPSSSLSLRRHGSRSKSRHHEGDEAEDDFDAALDHQDEGMMELRAAVPQPALGGGGGGDGGGAIGSNTQVVDMGSVLRVIMARMSTLPRYAPVRGVEEVEL